MGIKREDIYIYIHGGLFIAIFGYARVHRMASQWGKKWKQL